MILIGDPLLDATPINTTPLVTFDEIEAMKGLVRVLQPLIGDLLGRLRVQEADGSWQEVDIPSIYLSHPSTEAQDYPRVILTYNGDTNITPTEWEQGVATIDDPEGLGTVVTVPYTQTYLRYIITITCDSGSNQEVLRGNRASASTILRKLRDSLHVDRVREAIHQEMASTVTTIAAVTPTYALVDTSYHNSSNMALTFDVISTVYDHSGDYFNAVEHEGDIHRTEGDDDPLTSVKVVGPI